MDKIKFLIGKEKEFLVKPSLPFGSLEIDFLDQLSKELMSNREAKKFSDIISFAFWCRKKNIENLKKKYSSSETRVGLGCVFHVTPSNVPLNFAYSFAFGFLTGNSNLVKLPSQNFLQIDIFCKAIKKIVKIKRFKNIIKKNLFFKYNSDNQILTQQLSLKADGRMVWGGDKTIEVLKSFKTKPRTKDIFFSDRYSFCIIKSSSINKCNSDLLQKTIRGFYNDTYFMDQNACSSPHLVIWYGKINKKIKEKFWNTLSDIVDKKYDLTEDMTMDKYTKLCKEVLSNSVSSFHKYKNNVYTIDLKGFNTDINLFRGIYGYFYQSEIKNLNYLKKIINKKVQTLTYFGFNKSFFEKFFTNNSLEGIDRVVPIGQALDIDLIWDGYNLNNTLTRIIDIR